MLVVPSDQFRTYLVSYNHEGARWSMEIQARDADDARASVNRLVFATVDGEVKAKIVVTPRFLTRFVASFQRLLSLE
jgi:hypothetical protein